ncbi:MAG TPA: hypothetical protein VGH03_06995 [Caulobacteraceae bacterium]|jgi:hypothetical protein
MRTFTCVVTEALSLTSATTWIFAADDGRARELAVRELANITSPAMAEVYENGKFLFVEYAAGERPTPRRLGFLGNHPVRRPADAGT